MRTLSFTDPQGAPARYPPAPDGLTVYVVGDIHGRLDLLLDVQRRIDEDKIRFAHGRVVELYLGDYIDRGPDPAGVVSQLIGRAGRVYAEFLRGNHEQLLLDFLDGKDCLDEWFAVGGIATMLSYGLAPTPPSSFLAGDVVRCKLGEAIPPEHRRFYEKTGSYIRLGDYLAVHAGIRPSVPLEEQTAADLLGIRQGFLQFEGNFGFVVVHGHTPIMAPELRPNRINIDTGAFATSRLTCLKIDADGARVLQDDSLEADLIGGAAHDQATVEANMAGVSRIEAGVGDQTSIPNGDPYSVLGVGHQASAREVRAAYLRLAKELHPDGRLDDPIAAERLKVINHAYQELKEHGRRGAARKAENRTSARRLGAIFALGFVGSSALLLALFAYYGAFFGSQEPSKEATGPDSPANGSIFATSRRAPRAGLETAWMEAKRTATREAWQRFIDAYPDGDHAAKARQALVAIDAAEARERAERAELERTEAKARASAVLKGAKPEPQAARKDVQGPAAGQRWPSANEPFIGADARIRR